LLSSSHWAAGVIESPLACAAHCRLVDAQNSGGVVLDPRMKIEFAQPLEAELFAPRQVCAKPTEPLFLEIIITDRKFRLSAAGNGLAAGFAGCDFNGADSYLAVLDQDYDRDEMHSPMSLGHASTRVNRFECDFIALQQASNAILPAGMLQCNGTEFI
jgi:hypothetical protein